MDERRFPDPLDLDGLHGLRFSTATSAFQIEGSRQADGRGRSIWDDFVDTPGRVVDGSTAAPGPDSYRRWTEDVELLRRLGVDRYRFSLSWTRIIPDGTTTSRPNNRGLDHYERLVDALLDAGITPEPTLYHWDLPSPLEADGGWLDRDTAFRFAEYAEVVADRLCDRVRHWFTINEPASTALQGYAIGELAPGRTLLFEALPAIHHQLLAHGLATRIVREAGAEQAGLTLNHSFVLPETEGPADLMAAGLLDLIHNRIFTEPVLDGAYPDLAPLGAQMPVRGDDMDIISTPVDVYGFNYYNPTTVRATDTGPLPFDMIPTPGAEHTGFGPLWPIRPDTMRDFLIDLRNRYGERLPPVIIAENGASFSEPDHIDAPIEDTKRIDYLAGHLRAVAEARAAGVRIDEYTVWSLLDNFEWADGYTQRFGLVHVDMDTGDRTPKASFGWYRDLIEQVRA